MSDRSTSSGGPAAETAPPIDEAYRRLARLHYAYATADTVSETLHQRTVDDLMDVLELLEPLMANQSTPAT
jgi:hypothetical protein